MPTTSGPGSLSSISSLHDVNVRHVTLAKGAIASGLHQRGNEGDRASDFALAKRGGTHQHRLPGLDLLNVALVEKSNTGSYKASSHALGNGRFSCRTAPRPG
jgi:hypothetical protein